MQRVFGLRTQARRAIVSNSLIVAARKHVRAQNIFTFPFCVNHGDLSFRGVVLEFFEVSTVSFLWKRANRFSPGAQRRTEAGSNSTFSR